VTVHIKWKGYWRFSTNISLYFENGTRYGHSYNRRRIGTPTRSIECVILGVRPAPDHPHCLIEIKFGMRGSTPDVDWVFFSEPRRVKNRFSTMQSIQGQWLTIHNIATTCYHKYVVHFAFALHHRISSLESASCAISSVY